MACNVHDVISEMRKCCNENPRFDMTVERDLAERGMAVTMFIRNAPISDRNNVVHVLPYADYSVGDGSCLFYEIAWRLMVMERRNHVT